MEAKTVEERAAETLKKRLRGSFGYRAAESVVSGFSSLENMSVFKAHGGTEDMLPDSLDLVIERLKPQVTAKDISKDLDVDIGEAQTILDEEVSHYDEVVKQRTDLIKTLKNEFKRAPSEFTELSQFGADNFRRVVDNLLRSARAQYARTKNVTWAKAITDVVTPCLEELAKKAPKNEAPSDQVPA